MGLFAPEVAGKLGAEDIDRLLHTVGRETGAAAAILRSQPFTWDGIANPSSGFRTRPPPAPAMP
jgi:hypothetical protein